MLADYIAGIAGGIAVVLVGHPFDTTKTRLQIAPKNYYNSTLDCVQKTFQQQGIRGFYSGMSSPLAGQMIFRSVSFGTFHHLVSLSPSRSVEKAKWTELLCVGGVTGFVISFVETPIDLIKTKLQIEVFKSRQSGGNEPTQRPSISSTARHIMSSSGIRGFWQGWTATAIRNIPANAMFFPVNEMVKRTLAEWSNVTVRDLQPWQRLVAGACAGYYYIYQSKYLVT